MDSIQGVVGKYSDILTTHLREMILYLERQFGRRFVIEVGRCEGDFSYLMKMPVEIEDEMRLRFACKIAKILIDARGKRIAKAWFSDENQLLGFAIPLYSLRHARSVNTLKEVLMAAETFALRGKSDDEKEEYRGDLEQQIEQEVVGRQEDKCFLPDAWRSFRRKGYKPEEIRYDMCHIFR